MTSATPITKLAIPSPWVVLLQYAYLQVMDLLSTLAFLLSGIEEANPLVRFSMRATGDPLRGLLLVKCAAIALGLLCVWRGRLRLLQRINVFFALLVAWNLFSLIAGLMARMR